MIECDGTCCGNCGQTGGDGAVVVVDSGAADVAEASAEASVEVARIEAERDVATAKIYARGQDEDTAAMIAGMAARIEVLEAAAAPAVEEPIMIQAAAAPEPEPEAAAPVPEAEPKTETSSKRKQGFFR
jgi:hypothetical protein